MSPYNLRNWRLWTMCWRPSKIYDLLWHNVCWCSGKCLCIIFFCNCETGTKKHERRRSCGIRRKTSATWWLRYVPFGMVLIEQENRLLAKIWKPKEWKFGDGFVCRTQARGRGSSRRRMGNRKRRNSSSRRITISISKSLSQVIARRDKTRGCLFACLPLKRECKGNKFTVDALDVFFYM